VYRPFYPIFNQNLIKNELILLKIFKENMKTIIISIFTFALLFTACGYKTNPIYQSTKESK